jgi:hypothetical protein
MVLVVSVTPRKPHRRPSDSSDSRAHPLLTDQLHLFGPGSGFLES